MKDKNQQLRRIEERKVAKLFKIKAKRTLIGKQQQMRERRIRWRERGKRAKTRTSAESRY
jgi:hypothetical protein